MVGQIKVPLYSDSDLTTHVDDFYVMVVNRGEVNNYRSDVVTFPSNEAGTETTTNYKTYLWNNSIYGIITASLGINKYGNINVNGPVKDKGAYLAAQGSITAKVSELLSRGSVNLYGSSDKFNYYHLIDPTRSVDYYNEIGNRLSILLSSDTQYPNRRYANLSFYEGSTLLYNEKVLLESNSGDTVFRNEVRSAVTYATAKYEADNYSQALGNNKAYFGIWGCPFVYDDMSDISSWSSLRNVIRISKVARGSNFTVWNGGVNNWANKALQGSPYFESIASFETAWVYRWLGITDAPNVLDISNIPGTEYIDHGEQENDDDSYPGGGNDQNTYPPDGESGKGTFDNTNNPVDWNPLPTLDATTTGFISMWNPSLSEITDLYRFLWTSQIDVWEKLKNWFGDPMEAIISLGFVPVDPTIDGRRNVTIGLVDSGIEMNHVSKQFVEFDFGTLLLDEYYGAAWDFSPYTRIQIYLPYIGVQELDVDDVMGATLHLKYFIDLLSGATSAQLKCSRTRDNLNGIVYTWEGNCLMRVPVTSADARQLLTSIMQTIAIGGLPFVNVAAGALSTAMNEGRGKKEKEGAVGQWVNPTMAVYNAANVLGQKLHIQRGSRVDANAGVVSPQCAYLIIARPVSAIPKGWNEYAGYPSLKIKALSTQKGFTQVAYIKLNGLEATSEELSELDDILKGGVIL